MVFNHITEQWEEETSPELDYELREIVTQISSKKADVADIDKLLTYIQQLSNNVLRVAQRAAVVAPHSHQRYASKSEVEQRVQGITHRISALLKLIEEYNVIINKRLEELAKTKADKNEASEQLEAIRNTFYSDSF